MNWYLKVLKQYADFKGRARRKEYWMFLLFHLIFVFALVFLMLFSENTSDESPNMVLIIILALYFLATIVPSIAVTVRRLHDIGKSGSWYFISFIPYIGGFWLLILTCMDSENKPNKWGENPKGIGNDSVINQIGRE